MTQLSPDPEQKVTSGVYFEEVTASTVVESECFLQTRLTKHCSMELHEFDST